MSNVYERRAIVNAISPRDGELVQVVCLESEINETVAAALAANHTLRSVEPFWSVADEEAAFLESCPEEADCAFAM